MKQHICASRKAPLVVQLEQNRDREEWDKEKNKDHKDIKFNFCYDS